MITKLNNINLQDAPDSNRTVYLYKTNRTVYLYKRLPHGGQVFSRLHLKTKWGGSSLMGGGVSFPDILPIVYLLIVIKALGLELRY
jgi:hypothetical protein